ncbi:MAG: hypothetical protein Q8K99_06665 [Actinomycetota bacterium]|nr:hypothetical protein [Actinomycetota bacterium]
MLEYAMYVFAAPCFVVLPFPVEIYIRRREPRYLYLFTLGWVLFGLSPLFYLASETAGGLWGALFEMTMLAGVLLLVAGALSYFIAFSAARACLAILAICTLLLVLFLAVLNSRALGTLAQMLALTAPAAYGLLHRREFIRVGGHAYYWLVGFFGAGRTVCDHLAPE